MSDWETHWLGDVDYFVRCRAELVSCNLVKNGEPGLIGMEFEAFEGTGWPGNQAPNGWPKDVAYTVWKRDYKGDGDDIGVENLDDCHRAVYGQVRWDAQGHITFGEERDEGYLYCGDLEDAENIGRLLKHVWRIAWEFYLHQSAGGQKEDFE